MSNETQLAESKPRRASTELANFIGMAPDAMLDTIKAQCFKCSPSQVTDAQLGAFIAVCNEMKVNPLLPGMIYAYPNQGGIVPMMGPDFVFKKLGEHTDIESWEVEVFPADPELPPTHAIAKIWRKGRDRPISYTAFLKEWKMPSNPNWSSRPRHMLFTRALKQCARQVIHSMPFDEDDRRMMGVIDIQSEVVGQQTLETTPVTRPAIPTRGPGRPKKGLAAAASTPVAEVEPAKDDTAPAASAPVIEEAVVVPEAPVLETEPAREPLGILTDAAGEESDLFDPATAIKSGEYIRGNITISGFKTGNVKDRKLFCGQNAITYMNAEGAFKGTLYTHLHGNAALADGKTVKVVIESKTDDKGASQPFIKTIAE